VILPLRRSWNRFPEQRPDAVEDIVALLAHGRPNVMVVGNGDEIDKVLAQLAAHLLTPVAEWDPTKTGIPKGGCRTLIIKHAAQLTGAHQQDLLKLSSESGEPVHVIATSTESVFAAVTDGLFLDSLYYRLNTMLIEL
jgi:hypothetical protein